MSLVFRKGKWIEVALPKPVDPLWSLQDQKMYASLAVSLGEIHAEAFVHKKLHPGLVYSKEIAIGLEEITSHPRAQRRI